MRLRLYFYCNAVGDDVRAARSVTTDSPAGTRKILGICRALRSVGLAATIVSMGRGRAQGGPAYHPATSGRLDGIPVIYGPMSHRRVLSQLLTMAWLAAMARRLGSRHPAAVHLFYNQLTAYLPALAWLRLTRRRTALDIEDGPVAASPGGYRTRFGNASPGLFGRLINGGALLACSALAAGTRIRPVLPYYGAIGQAEEESGTSKRFEGPSLDILYSGYLDEDTGVALLGEAVRTMRIADTPDFDALCINIAGMGPGLARLQALEGGRRPGVRILGRLDGRDYRAWLRRCAVGLSLKRPAGAFADSTFPSKTVEYAEYGLAIVSTDISDVRLLFGDALFYVKGDDAGDLVAQLSRAVRNRRILASKAAASRKVVLERLSCPSAGRVLTAFLFDRERA